MNSRRLGSLWAPSLETIYHKGVFLTAGAGDGWGKKAKGSQGRTI